MRSLSLLLAASLLGLACTSSSEERIEVGDSWQLALELTHEEACPAFALPESFQVFVSDLDGYLVLSSPPGDRVAIIELDTESGIAGFLLHDDWADPDGGFSVSPTIEFVIEIDGDGHITGTASTSFLYDTETEGTTCRYSWAVSGDKQPVGECKAGSPRCG